jgi:hypothetical protein
MRPWPILVGLLILGLPAAAEEPQKGTGRYAVSPSDDGFIRLDTETGATTHCGRREGVWRCDVLAEDRSALEAKIDALGDKVAALSAEVDKLAASVAALQAAQSETAKPPTAPPPLTEEDRQIDQASRFAERLMHRFFDMIRALKRDETQGI